MTKVGIGSRCGRATAAAWRSPKSTTIAQLSRALPSARHSAAEDVTLLRGDRSELGFSVGIGKSQDKSTIFVSTGDNATSEVRFVDADDPTRPLTLISPRREKREYSSTQRTASCDPDQRRHVNFRLAEADPGNRANGRRSSGVGQHLSDGGSPYYRDIWQSAAESKGSTS